MTTREQILEIVDHLSPVEQERALQLLSELQPGGSTVHGSGRASTRGIVPMPGVEITLEDFRSIRAECWGAGDDELRR